TGVGNESPPNGATGVPVDTGLRAKTAFDYITPPVSYLFEIFKGGLCTGQPVATSNYTSSFWQPPSPLLPGTKYAWHNKAKHSHVRANGSAFGPCTTFTTEGDGSGAGGAGGTSGEVGGAGGAGVGGAGAGVGGASTGGGATSSAASGGDASGGAVGSSTN